MTKQLPRSTRDEAALLRYLKGSGRLLISEYKGDLWWADGYIARKVDRHLEGLLSDFNLTAGVMRCTVGRTIIKNGTEPVDFAKLIQPTKGLVEVEPLMVGGMPLVAEGLTHSMQLWSADGKTVALAFNSKLVAQAFARIGGRTLYNPVKPEKAALRVDDDGKPAALLMPVRMSEGIGGFVMPEMPEPMVRAA